MKFMVEDDQQIFTNAASFHKHKSRNHPEVRAAAKKQNQYECSNSGKSFN
jgi:hypothetical protein